MIPYTPEVGSLEGKLARHVKGISIGRGIQYTGVGMLIAGGPTLIAAGIDAGFSHSTQPLLYGGLASLGLLCFGPSLAVVGWSSKQAEKRSAHHLAEYLQDQTPNSADPLIRQVNLHRRIGCIALALEAVNIATLIGAIATPPPFDVILGLLHIGGRFAFLTKISHSFAIERMAWGQVRRLKKKERSYRRQLGRERRRPRQ